MDFRIHEESNCTAGTPATKSVFEENQRHGIFYTAELDEEYLMAVRADIGVDMVECNQYAELIAGRVDWFKPEGAESCQEGGLKGDFDNTYVRNEHC